MRDLPWLIDSIEYDHKEDNEEVYGSWAIYQVIDDERIHTDIVAVLYRPYDDGSAPVEYLAKATRYRVTLINEVEGDNAEEAFESWKK